MVEEQGIFFIIEMATIRPSQNNTTNVYGGSLNFSKIEILNIDNYKETIIKYKT